MLRDEVENVSHLWLESLLWQLLRTFAICEAIDRNPSTLSRSSFSHASGARPREALHIVCCKSNVCRTPQQPVRRRTPTGSLPRYLQLRTSLDLSNVKRHRRNQPTAVAGDLPSAKRVALSLLPHCRRPYVSEKHFSIMFQEMCK